MLLCGKRAIVIGNGEMGKLSARLLHEAGCRVMVTLRTYRHGETVVPSGCEAQPYDRRFEVQPDAGANLIFITLPNIFNEMPGGRLWGALFFVFMSFAAMSTVTAVFENILSCWMDKWNVPRKKAVWANLILIFVLSLPCLLSFNILSDIKFIGMGIFDLEDFIVTQNLLPLGSLLYLLFCVVSKKYAWGYENFLQEADQGKGIRFPAKLRLYFTWILPLIVLAIFVLGYQEKFF